MNVKGLDYTAIKRAAQAAEPMQVKFDLGDLEINSNGQLAVQGVGATIDKEVVLPQLYKLFGISKSVLKTVRKGLGEDMENELIKQLQHKLAQSKKSDKGRVTLITNPNNGLITNILRGDRDFISNEFALQRFEELMNSDNDYRLVGATINPNGGLTLNVVKGEDMKPLIKAENRLNEDFNPGFTLVNNPYEGLEYHAFVLRLICGNGAMMTNTHNRFVLGARDGDSIDKWLELFYGFKQDGFLPAEFPKQMERAMETPASFFELKMARNIMLNNSKLESAKDMDAYLPEFNNAVEKLAARGRDYAKCTDQQLKNFPVNTKVWDVYNRITDFGSHNYGFDAKFDKIQEEAGRFFNRDVYDTDNLILLN